MRPEEQSQRCALTIDRGRIPADPAPRFDPHRAFAFRVRDADRKGGGPRYMLLAPSAGHAGERLTAHRRRLKWCSGAQSQGPEQEEAQAEAPASEQQAGRLASSQVRAISLIDVTSEHRIVARAGGIIGMGPEGSNKGGRVACLVAKHPTGSF